MSIRFLGKVAVICNIFFLIALILRYRQFSEQQDFNSHVILLGWLLAPIVNCIFVLWWWISRKKAGSSCPLYIVLITHIFLLVQIYLFFTLK